MKDVKPNRHYLKNETAKVVYISGAITGYSPEEYLPKFKEVEKRLTARGYVVVNPAEINDHLPLMPNRDFAFTHEGYMKVSLALLSLCEFIYVIDGEGTSKGVALELSYAGANGIKRLHTV